MEGRQDGLEDEDAYGRRAVLAKDPSDATLDLLVTAHRLFAGGPTCWEAREVLVGWTRPGIAARVAAEIEKTRAEVEIHALLVTLVKRREAGNEALLGRLARDPKREGVVFYGSDVGFQLDMLRALVAVGAASLIDVICDVLPTETFAVYGTRFEGIFENEAARGPAIAKAVLASPRFPRPALSPDVIGTIERIAAQA